MWPLCREFTIDNFPHKSGVFLYCSVNLHFRFTNPFFSKYTGAYFLYSKSAALSFPQQFKPVSEINGR